MKGFKSCETQRHFKGDDEMSDKAIDQSDWEEQKSQLILNSMLESFFHRWKPRDSDMQDKFHAEFYSLVRRIYMDAGEPAINQLTKVLNCLPLVLPTVIK